MKKRKKICTVAAMGTLLTMVLFSGCGKSEKKDVTTETQKEVVDTAQTTETTETQPETLQASSGTIYVAGYEWGPGVPKVIIKLPNEADSVDASDVKVSTAGVERTVTKIYLSDEKGNEITSKSLYTTIEMETTNKTSGTPFTYDFQKTMMNHWSDSYPVSASFEVTENKKKTMVSFDGDCINNRICPDTDLFSVRGNYSGQYDNAMTGKKDDLTLLYAAYEPQTLKEDNQKNPLIIWLHGQGEGGTDPDIALLGNKVTALAKEGIQKKFTTKDGSDGAYVLAVQCPTYWMDGGDGTNSSGDITSRYTKILMDTIEKYVSSNPDLDTNRIYLSGCSNGGYMTMNMLVNYPTYWAAAIPTCEAYAFDTYERNADGSYKEQTAEDGKTKLHIATSKRWMTKEKIADLKNIPIWFVQSANDNIVNPSSYGMPTYQALLKAGAKNCWYSMFETVKGTDDATAEYMGHWSWIYLFNQQVSGVQDQDKIAASTDTKTFGFEPTNQGGGTLTASDENGSYDSVFSWLNAQVKK